MSGSTSTNPTVRQFPTDPAFVNLGLGGNLKLLGADDSVTPPAPGYVLLADLLAQVNQTSAAGVLIDGVTIPATPAAPYVMRTIDFCVALKKTTGAPSGIQLPANPLLWTVYRVFDAKPDCGTNNCTVTPPANGNIGGQPNYLMNYDGDSIEFMAISQLEWWPV